MPIHDWRRVKAGKFHDFHQDWVIEISRALNNGVLPPGYSAETAQQVIKRDPEDDDDDDDEVEKNLRRRVPDVVAISYGWQQQGGLSVATAPPRSRQVAKIESEELAYARNANRLLVRTEDDTIVALIEVLSPGNKHDKRAIKSFRSKIVKFLRRGISVVLIDLFPPSRRDPQGIHQFIWGELANEPFDRRPADKPLTVASYDAGGDLTAYVDSIAVGDVLPDAPLFLAPGRYVNIPLEQTYERSWSLGPKSIRDLFEKADSE